MVESTKRVRVRIAPGPTGPFHIGRSRTALMNWLFARRHGGTFVLRIEDTDRERSKPEHLQSILDSLRWLGLEWDEGPDKGGPYAPYFQMGRLESYRENATCLLESGKAYECFCTVEELNALRDRARKEHRPFRYPRTCRYLTEEQREARRRAGIVPVLRIVVPDEGTTSFDDMILGPLTFQNSELDDFVIMRGDGIPTYNFAVVIDDATMDITHVIRGQDHVPNTPKQLIVYDYIGTPIPSFAHLPLVVGMEDREKISARHGAGAVSGYAESGYLPEAIVNYLATLGASYEGDREIFSPDELIEVFELSKLSKSGSAFDPEKLEWMNGVHIRALPLADFVGRSLPFLEIRGLVASPPSEAEVEYATKTLRLEQERVRTLAETPDAVEFFFQEDLLYDPALLIVKRSTLEDARRVVKASLDAACVIEPFQHDALEPAFRALAGELGLKTGVVFGTIRVAITGRIAAPPLFDTMEALGRDRVVVRLRRAGGILESWQDQSS